MMRLHAATHAHVEKACYAEKEKSVRIVFDDGREFIPPKEENGFGVPHIATDRQTVGWAVETANCCTSYPIPMSLAIFRSNRIIGHIETIQTIWEWLFVNDGANVAVAEGPTHGGPAVYRLYDTVNGALLETRDVQKLDANAPEWAKQLEHQLSDTDRPDNDADCRTPGQ